MLFYAILCLCSRFKPLQLLIWGNLDRSIRIRRARARRFKIKMAARNERFRTRTNWFRARFCVIFLYAMCWNKSIDKKKRATWSKFKSSKANQKRETFLTLNWKSYATKIDRHRKRVYPAGVVVGPGGQYSSRFWVGALPPRSPNVDPILERVCNQTGKIGKFLIPRAYC